MPDWISHILFGLIICHLFNIKKKSLVILGALLPDIIGKLKMLNYIFPGSPDWLIPLSNVWHTPFPSIISALLIALFFFHQYLETAILIILGDISHFLSDGTTKSFIFDGYLPILWADQYYWAILFFAVIYAVLILFNIKFVRDQNESTIKTT